MPQPTEKQSKNDAVKWATRIGVCVIFFVLIVMAAMDYRAKTNATSTTTAWLDILKQSADNDKQLRCSDLPAHVVGSPHITGKFTLGEVVYTWRGIFRNYTTTVTCEDEEQPIVLRIEGPGS